MLILIALATFMATFIGGYVAIKMKDRLHLILGFSAGAVLGVAFFDLLPESMELGSQFFGFGFIASLIALGFIIYLALDRMILLCCHTHEDGEHNHQERGVLGAGSLAIHSLLDGVAIGLAFQVSTAIGAIVAVAVLVHDFSDGINTVNFLLKNKNNTKTAFSWLILDALAPVVGITSTLFFKLPQQYLGIMLALFTGFFLYIGASDLIPESHHSHPKLLTTLMTMLGVAVMYLAIRFATV